MKAHFVFRWIVAAAAGAAVLMSLAFAAGTLPAMPTRVNFSGNLEGEFEPCGCQIPKGGLARRAGFLSRARVDSVLNLTLDAGNFAPAGRMRSDTIKLLAFADFFRRLNYDAVALSSRETSFGFDFWRQQSQSGLPLLAANAFADSKAKKPLFNGWKNAVVKSNGQYLIKTEKGRRLGVIGFLTESAWNARRERAADFSYRSPFECGKLIRKARKQCDVLVVAGEFTRQEADSFARSFPETDLIVSSGIRTDQLLWQGRTAVIGSTARGYFANYLEWNPLASDTLRDCVRKSQVLDSTIADDTTWARKMKEIKYLSNAAIPAP